MIQINIQFIKAFTPNEQLLMLQLLLKADNNGVVEFSDRGLSRLTEIPYQQVRTIHQKWLLDGTLVHSPSNAGCNANKCFVTICDYDSYTAFNNISNAVINALKEKEIIKDKEEVFPQTSLQGDTENNKEKIVKKKEELDLSIVEEQYLPIVNDWLQYKKERKEGYKPTGFKTFYNHLIKLSNNNPVLARKIVDKSMSSNYAGIFELKESDVKAEETESREYTKLEKFIKWVKEGYPTIREMEMPNEEQLNEIIRISGSNMIWYFDQLQDYYHEGSLYELFMERFGGNR